MLKNTRNFIVACTFALAGLVGSPQAGWADLADVGPINLANGYPLWWEDQNGTQVELCLDAANCPPFEPLIPGNAFSEQIGFAGESFWWAAGADMEANPAGLVLFELAMEAAFFPEEEAPGNQEPFVRLRVRVDVDVVGTYTITYPFGTLSVDVTGLVPGPEINQTIDLGGAAIDVPPYSAALATGVPPVVADASTHGVSVFFTSTNPATPVGFMGVPGVAATVAGIADPNVTIAGPPGAFGGAGSLTNGGLWDVAGKLFIPGVNEAPTAVPDFSSTTLATPVTINVVANDVDTFAAGVNDHAINPLAVALGNDTANLINNAIGATNFITTARGGTATINADGTITYVPAGTFSGTDTFSYVVQDTGGMVSTAQVSVVVEQLATTAATLRSKLLKWDASGTSTITQLTGTDGAGNAFYFTPLSGLWNTPLRDSSAGSGSVILTVIRDISGTVTDLDYTLQIDGLTDITAAHIHSGALGELGPIAVTLFDADGDLATVSGPAGTGSPLLVTPASRFPAGNTPTITDVDDPVGGPLPDLNAVVEAIIAGQAYVQVHTVAVPPGEIRGQLGRNAVALRSGSASGAVIGTAAVTGTGTNGSWRFSGKSAASPGASGNVFIQSAAQNTQLIPLQLR